MLLRINNFFGLAPTLHPTALGEGLSVEATNIDTGRGLLEPWQTPLALGVNVGAETKTIFHYLGAQWFTWPERVGCTRVPIANDPMEHVVITDSDYPKITRSDVALASAPYPAITYRLGIPVPDKPTVATVENPDWTTPDGGITDEELIAIDTQYKITFVDSWGREGAGSLSSDIFEFDEYEGELRNFCKLTLPEPPTGNFNFGQGAAMRIYRTATGDAGGVFMFVAEVPITQTEYTDKTLDRHLAEPMITDTWVGPPDDDITLYPDGPLQNVAGHPNGFLFGNTKHEVCFSEPGTSHAWPVGYRHYVDDPIVGVSMLGSDVVALTTAYPVVFTGVHPEAMSPIRFGETSPCVSADSVCEVAGRVFFASNKGLMAVTAQGVENVLRGHMTEQQWKALEPETVRGAEYNGRYVLFTKNHGTYMVTPGSAENLLHKVEIDAHATEAQQKRGELVYADRGQLYQFSSGSELMQYKWTSKTYRLPTNTRFLWGKVIAEQYPVEVEIHCLKTNGNTVTTRKVVTSDKPFPLKTGYQGREWWVSARGENTVRTVLIAQHQREFET